ncbi:MAG: hypothetical protein ABR607_12285 [Pyrinomonadaceae bacterium]
MRNLLKLILVSIVPRRAAEPILKRIMKDEKDARLRARIKRLIQTPTAD